MTKRDVELVCTVAASQQSGHARGDKCIVIDIAQAHELADQLWQIGPGGSINPPALAQFSLEIMSKARLSRCVSANIMKR